jgi:catechol 2,3-dioxygenase-like lactoylglutathione lyase family enzyme
MEIVSGGHPTIYVSDFDVSVAFYTQKLGLKLVERFDNEWALLDAGHGLRLGLHPATPAAPRPGTSGAITIGFGVDGSLDEAIEALKARGVWFRGPIVEQRGIRVAFFGDPDGNDLYLSEVA